MKLSELINELVNLATDLNPGCDDTDILNAEFDVDPKVRLATQPTWPLAHNICNLQHLPSEESTSEDPGILWIAEGSSCHDSPYAPRAAWGE